MFSMFLEYISHIGITHNQDNRKRRSFSFGNKKVKAQEGLFTSHMATSNRLNCGQKLLKSQIQAKLLLL